VRPTIWRHYGPRLLALLIVTGLIALAASRLTLTRVVAELAVVQLRWIMLALLCYLTILPLWAMQWRILAPAAPKPALPRMLGVVAMTSTVLNSAPLLVGEAAGIFFLVTVAELSRAAALSVLAMDQLLVGIAKVVVLATAASLISLPEWMARSAAVLLAGVALLLATLLLVAWQAERLARLASQLLPPAALRALVSIGTALAPLRSPTRGGSALLLALAKKLVEVGAIMCVARAFSMALPATSAILVLAALNLATLLPIVPGNVGVYEAAVVLAYSYFGVSGERALGIALVQHACYFAALALPGYRWLARAAAIRNSAAAA
jgi:uncharacterized membrane protein YbhN (UPF0104 family)